jgi:LPS-assembly lipoprotein
LKHASRHLITLLLAASLAACGFHMRGTTPDSQMSFKSIYLDVKKGSAIERDLRTAIRFSDAQLAADAKAADVTLRIVRQSQQKKILTLNAQGKVREYSLTYQVQFEILDANNKKLLQPPEMVMQYILSYSEEQALAKEQEERMTFDDMRRDAVSQIMRQLARLHPETM